MNPTDSDFESKVTLESEKGGIAEELPFRLLILGDWSGDGAKRDLSERRPIEIDRDNFDDVMKRLGVRLSLDLQDDGNALNLEFNELEDFHPDNLFHQVSLFSDLRDIRRRLLSADTFNSAASEVRSWSAETEKPNISGENKVVAEENAPIDSDNLLDQILSGSAAAAPAQAAQSSELSSLIRDLVKPHLVGIDENEQSELLSVVDIATSDLMRRILHHWKFQSLEAAWRGLYFLVKRTDTDSDLKIFILDVTKDELGDNLKSFNSLAETLAYRWLVAEATEMPGGEPWAVICGNYAFNPDVEDAATLIRLAKLSAAADAPFISHIRPEILGIRSLAESPSPENWNLSDDSTTGKLWATLRSLPESAYLGLTIPRFLARLPYGAETEPLENFAFEEFPDKPVHNQFVWANVCFICAALLAESFRSFSWNMARSLKQDVEGLPLYIYKEDSETVTKPCAEVYLSQTACEKLMDYGLMPLISFRNSDRVRLARFQSISEPVTALGGKWK